MTGFHIIRHLTRGGMGDVYLACEVATGRQVALKHSLHTTADARALFADEARLGAQLDHPNVARVVAAGDDYLATEYVDGIDAGELIARSGGALPYDAACAIVAAAAAGLDHAHRCGIVHRDVSPSNIMVGFDGGVKVIDFGIARGPQSLHCSVPGIIRGKPAYLAPEQCHGHPVDARTDVFALGAVLYELTTGARCFDGETDLACMLAIVRGDYVAPARRVPGFPPGLAQVIAIALAPDPAWRFPSAAAMYWALCADGRAVARLMDAVQASRTAVDVPIFDEQPTRALRRAA